MTGIEFTPFIWALPVAVAMFTQEASTPSRCESHTTAPLERGTVFPRRDKDKECIETRNNSGMNSMKGEKRAVVSNAICHHEQVVAYDDSIEVTLEESMLRR